MGDDGLPDLTSSPVAVWTAMAVLVVLALATISEKGLGPISRSWYAFAKNRREAAASRRAADVAELEARIESLSRQLASQRLEHADAVAEQDREIAGLRSDIAAYRADQRARDLMALAHQRWDLQVLAEINRLGGTVPEPPPLWPTEL
jgi:hypothetical protein